MIVPRLTVNRFKMEDLHFRTNEETLEFVKAHENLAREVLLTSTRSFFGSIKTNRCNTLCQKMKDFQNKNKIIKQKIKTKIMKELGGTGKGYTNPPETFAPRDLSIFGFIKINENGCYTCEKCDQMSIIADDLQIHIHLNHLITKRGAFVNECFEKVNDHHEYKMWQEEVTDIPLVTFASVEEKELHDEIFKEDMKKVYMKLSNANSKVLSLSKTNKEIHGVDSAPKDTFSITRQRSSGPNILEAERNIYTIQDDGTQKKTVIKDVFAKVTTRNTPKRKNDDKENTSPKKIKLTHEGMSKQAKNVRNILNHVTAHDTEAQAMLIAKVVDQHGSKFAAEVTKNSKEIQGGLKMSPLETASVTAGMGIPDNAAIKLRTAMNKAKGWNMLASHKKVKQIRETKLPFEKDAWSFQEHMLYRNKQGQNKKTQKKTQVAIVKDLKSYIQTHAMCEKDQLGDGDILPVVIDGDAGGGRFVAEFTFLNRKDKSLKLHPFLLYEGTDNRENMQKTLGQLTQQIRSLEGTIINLDTKEYHLQLFCLFDLCALNNVLGKQNHSATYPDAWTDVTKTHLSYDAHKGTPHTPETCMNIRFVSLDELERHFTHHAVETGKTSGMNKTGKDFYSVINQNLIPLIDIFRFVPPLLHIIMGLGNNIFTELKNEIVSLDKNEAGIVDDTNAKNIREHLNQLYKEKDKLEIDFSDTQLAHMISINDYARIKLLKDGKVDEASRKAEENYESVKKKRKLKKNDCDAEICIIFPCDEASEWDESFSCCKGCKIHLRCEGMILEDDCLPDDYECNKCRTGSGNKTWLEEKVYNRKMNLEEKVEKLKGKHNNISMDIERIEEEESIVDRNS